VSKRLDGFGEAPCIGRQLRCFDNQQPFRLKRDGAHRLGEPQLSTSTGSGEERDTSVRVHGFGCHKQQSRVMEVTRFHNSDRRFSIRDDHCGERPEPWIHTDLSVE
jgi:hypothetical protein